MEPYTFVARTFHALGRPGGISISYLSPLLAVGVGIVHAAIAPVIVVGGVKPNLVLVAVVLVTCLFGFLPGITWAFAAGLTANLLTSEPLGLVPLSMLVVAAVVAGGARVLGRMTWIYPIAAVFAGSLVADVVSVGVGSLVADAGPPTWPTPLLFAAATLNAVICGLLLVPVRLAVTRYTIDEPAW